MSEEVSGMSGWTVIPEGPFAGWRTWSAGADPFETMCGPFCYTVVDGAVRTALQPERKHLNGSMRALHGGLLMTFADFSLFAIADEALGASRAVTLTCNCEFVGAANATDVIYGEGRVVRQTRGFVFVQGLLTQAGAPVLSFSGALRKFEPRG